MQFYLKMSDEILRVVEIEYLRNLYSNNRYFWLF